MISIVEDESSWSEFNVLAKSFKGKLFTGHFGASNYLFVDGHVSQLPPEAVLDWKGSNNDWTDDGQPFVGNQLTLARKILGVGN